MLLRKVLLSRLSTFWPRQTASSSTVALQRIKHRHFLLLPAGKSTKKAFSRGLYSVKEEKERLSSPSHGGTDKKLMETSYNTKAFFTRSVITLAWFTFHKNWLYYAKEKWIVWYHHQKNAFFPSKIIHCST